MSYNSSNYEKNCEHCGQPFYAERSTKKYCSDSCRTLAYLNNKARKLANASFVEDAIFEVIPDPASVNPQSDNLLDEAPIETEATEEVSTQDKNREYTRRKTQQRSKKTKSAKAAPESSHVDVRLIVLGVMAAVNLVVKYFSDSDPVIDKPKPAVNTCDSPL